MSLSEVIYGTRASGGGARPCAARNCTRPMVGSYRTREAGTLDLCHEHLRILRDAGEIVAEPPSHFVSPPPAPPRGRQVSPRSRTSSPCPTSPSTRSGSSSPRPLTRKPGELPGWALPEPPPPPETGEAGTPPGATDSDADPGATPTPAATGCTATASSAAATSPDLPAGEAVPQDGETAQEAPAAMPTKPPDDGDDTDCDGGARPPAELVIARPMPVHVEDADAIDIVEVERTSAGVVDENSSTPGAAPEPAALAANPDLAVAESISHFPEPSMNDASPPTTATTPTATATRSVCRWPGCDVTRIQGCGFCSTHYCRIHRLMKLDAKRIDQANYLAATELPATWEAHLARIEASGVGVRRKDGESPPKPPTTTATQPSDVVSLGAPAPRSGRAELELAETQIADLNRAIDARDAEVSRLCGACRSWLGAADTGLPLDAMIDQLGRERKALADEAEDLRAQLTDARQTHPAALRSAGVDVAVTALLDGVGRWAPASSSEGRAMLAALRALVLPEVAHG